jgi:hypothetical protein
MYSLPSSSTFSKSLYTGHLLSSCSILAAFFTE